jgi:hypothetical protein
MPGLEAPGGRYSSWLEDCAWWIGRVTLSGVLEDDVVLLRARGFSTIQRDLALLLASSLCMDCDGTDVGGEEVSKRYQPLHLLIRFY